MAVFVCTDHDSHYPVGCASVVIADTEEQAREMLDLQLREHCLMPHWMKPYTLQLISTGEARAIVLNDGDY